MPVNKGDAGRWRDGVFARLCTRMCLCALACVCMYVRSDVRAEKQGREELSVMLVNVHQPDGKWRGALFVAFANCHGVNILPV